MSAASKTLKASDVQVFPYATNKIWRVNTSSYSDIGINIFTGKKSINSSSIITLPASVSLIQNPSFSSNTFWTMYTSSQNLGTLQGSWSISNSFAKTFPTGNATPIFYQDIASGYDRTTIHFTYILSGSVSSTNFLIMGRNILTGDDDTIFFDSTSSATSGNPGTYDYIITASLRNYSKLGMRVIRVNNSQSLTSYFDAIGLVTASGVFLSESAITTDLISGQVQSRSLLYDSIKHLYYSNYFSASYLNNSSSYNNYEQTTLLYNSGSYLKQYNGPIKYIPTASDTSVIRVVSIPQNIFGSKIIPSSFQVSGAKYNIIDDGEGNLLDISGSTTPVGNIIYPHGLITITHPSYSLIFPTASSDFFDTTGSLSGSFDMIFKGEHIIYENEVRCTVHEDEFNYTLNPSISTDNSGSLRGFATSSDFNPYVTTVGLYNEVGELLVVGKMSKPVPIPRNSDITFLIKWDS